MISKLLINAHAGMVELLLWFAFGGPIVFWFLDKNSPSPTFSGVEILGIELMVFAIAVIVVAPLLIILDMRQRLVSIEQITDKILESINLDHET